MPKFLIGVLLLLKASLAGAFTVEISEGELQEKVAAVMPYETKKLMMTIVLSNPVVELGADTADMRIVTDVDVVAPGGIAKSGKVRVVSPVSYEQGTAGFYLKDPVVEDLVIEKLPDSYLAAAKKVTQAMVSKIFKNHAVYTLKGDSLKSSLAKSFLKSVAIENRRLVFNFELF